LVNIQEIDAGSANTDQNVGRPDTRNGNFLEA
jgi:hypothetical protein